MSDTNSGGWASSHTRNDICPQFLELLPTDLYNTIEAVTKYTDNVGNGTGDIESNVTATQDKVFLLAEYEYYIANFSNSYEDNYTKPYSFYGSNNTRMKFNSYTNTDKCIYWTRSPQSSNANRWCAVLETGLYGAFSAEISFGFSPAIVIY